VRVLLVGGGGREDALAWALARSPSVDALFAAPGNPGIARVATCESLAVGDLPGIVAFVRREGVDLVVVGPEAPLVAGLADELRAAGVSVFGPGREGARLEGSKAWARALCDRHGIPSPSSRAFTDVGPALGYLEELGEPPFVVKADGLAAGKGVIVAPDRPAAERAVRACLEQLVFGDAGRVVVIEQFLVGEEVSAMAFADGRTVVPMALAQDFKRVGEGDTGPNTGGMGAYSPVPFVDEDARARIDAILRAAASALSEEGIDYRGVIYAGLMLTADGPRLIEFNCRFGDPETQVVVPRLDADLAETALACAEGRLADQRISWRDDACVAVVLASGGYPGLCATGVEIDGLERAEEVDGVQVFHAGTAERDGRVVTAGGRVLTVSALGPSLDEARARAYQACSLVRFDGMHYRRDIALTVGARERT